MIPREENKEYVMIELKDVTIPKIEVYAVTRYTFKVDEAVVEGLSLHTRYKETISVTYDNQEERDKDYDYIKTMLKEIKSSL